MVAEGIIQETLPGVDCSVKIGKQEYTDRRKRVQQAMAAKGYMAGYACGSELDRSDAAWLAGVFDPIIERYGVLVPREGAPVVFAGSEGGHVIEEAVEQSGAAMALLLEFQISDEEYRHAHFVSLDRVLEQQGLKSGTGKVAIFSSAEFIPYEHVRLFQDKLGAENVVFDPELLQLIKYEKSDTELEIIGIANVIADAAFRGMLAATVPGTTELAVAAVGDYIMKGLGAGRTGFPTIVTAGDRGYTVIGPATNYVIQKGDMVSLGLSPTFNGYHGITRRTVRAGADPTPRQMEFIGAVEGLYRVVMDALREAAAKGLPSNTVDQAGKRYLESLKLETISGEKVTPQEPYTFVHNTGCSECQEGYGAITPHTDRPLGNEIANMIDVALMGFKKRGKPLFEVLYAVVEDAFWKKGSETGVYNRLPLNVQHLVGSDATLGENVNPYYRSFGTSGS